MKNGFKTLLHFTTLGYALLLLTTFSSCAKERTCACYDNNGVQTGSWTSSIYTKKKFKEKCEVDPPRISTYCKVK